MLGMGACVSDVFYPPVSGEFAGKGVTGFATDRARLPFLPLVLWQLRISARGFPKLYVLPLPR